MAATNMRLTTYRCHCCISVAEIHFLGAAPESGLCSVAAGADGPAQALLLDGIVDFLLDVMEQFSESCTRDALWLQGLGALPKHCIQMCIGFFFAAVAISVLRDVLPKKYAAFVPIPMAAAIPFYIGAQLAVSPRHCIMSPGL